MIQIQLWNGSLLNGLTKMRQSKLWTSSLLKCLTKMRQSELWARSLLKRLTKWSNSVTKSFDTKRSHQSDTNLAMKTVVPEMSHQRDSGAISCLLVFIGVTFKGRLHLLQKWLTRQVSRFYVKYPFFLSGKAEKVHFRDHQIHWFGETLVRRFW